MATQGPLSPGTITDNGDEGNLSWTDISNAAASDNAYADTSAYPTGGTIDWSKIILLIGGSEAGNDKAAGAGGLTGSDAYITRGGASDKWGLTPTDTQINASNFGVRIQLTDGGSDWLTTTLMDCTNFGFTIPSGATIDGITVEIENKASAGVAYIDHVRITVNYTGGGGGGGGSNSSFLAFFRKVKEWLGWGPRRRSQTLAWSN